MYHKGSVKGTRGSIWITCMRVKGPGLVAGLLRRIAHFWAAVRQKQAWHSFNRSVQQRSD